MAQKKPNKLDRRTRYTRQVIKDAFLELTRDHPYDKINVAMVCRQAEIARATFYLHYENLDEVLDQVLDDALIFSEQGRGTVIDMTDVLRKDGAESGGLSEAVLPACQRIADSDKYHALFMDPTVSHHILYRIADHEREKVIPELMARSGLAEDEAEMLFKFILHGSFAVNRSLGWNKDARWYRYQKILADFIGAGVEKTKKS
ncbi:MAG: TetR/AcrR family transcriptional regulator [Pseudoramibacter sp.]